MDVKGADILLVTPGRLFRRATSMDSDRHGMRFPRSRCLVDAELERPRRPEAANFGMFIGSYENMRRVSMRHPRGGPSSWARHAHCFGECGRLACRLQLPLIRSPVRSTS